MQSEATSSKCRVGAQLGEEGREHTMSSEALSDGHNGSDDDHCAVAA